MSAAEKLKALPVPFDLSEGHSTMLVLVDALPQIVAVIEAAEKGRDRSVLIEEHVSTIEKVAWRVEDAQTLQAALVALDEKLGAGA